MEGAVESTSPKIALPSDLSAGFNYAWTTAQTIISKVVTVAKECFINLQNRVRETSLDPTITVISRQSMEVEKIFNAVSCLPFLGFLASSIRSVVGKIQIAAGAAIAAAAEVGLFLESRKEGEKSLLGKWQTLSKFGMEHVIHGCLNVLRGTSEALLSSYTFGLGNIALLAPNLCNNREFKPYFGYGTLVKPIVTTP